MLGLTMPSEALERDDPHSADAFYEAYSNLPIEHTRDKKKFPLVFKELVNYGFRGNWWGMKPVGITVAISCIVFSGHATFISQLTRPCCISYQYLSAVDQCLLVGMLDSSDWT
jgi:hypothetical protein